ncbi:MAG: hypothetical protein IMY72_01855 [Bacteroidetes bacterium]|nr:hypothetical protein [Bacteroidota bacterium]
MREKKTNNFQSPDLNKLQGVIIDQKTTIYIPLGSDPEKAKTRYFHQRNSNYIKK